jgi:SAM-dependent methyltransferase
VEEQPQAETRQRLARIAATFKTPIETVDGVLFDDAGTYSWRDYMRLAVRGKRPPDDQLARPDNAKPPPIDEAFLQEAHHRQYGRPWAMGKFIFDYAVARGLQPRHRLLDFGCGALRFGNYAIAYLEPGRYYGIDAHLKSLEAAVTYEIPIHNLADKRPHLLWNADYAVDHFGVRFDWIVDYAASLHVPKDDLEAIFGKLHDVLSPRGRLLVCCELRLPVSAMEDLGLRLVHQEEQKCRLLRGHSFASNNRWFEFQRKDARRHWWMFR